ncbi:MAG TPA: acetate/propionate family kinase, partial [Devosia sp.]|nr:acetate/propionate family kinase [Devosia sp.]
MTSPILLTLNPGSSTIKLGLYTIESDGPRRLGKGIIDLGHSPLLLQVTEGATTADIAITAPVTDDLHGVIAEILDWLMQHFGVDAIAGVGHRVVHGGDGFTGCARVTEASLSRIEALVPLAPLHQPQSVRLIKAISHLMPDVPQTASFDTAFHRTQTDLVRRFALPRALFDQGIKRYGFHG